jgi:hypothetical protein
MSEDLLAKHLRELPLDLDRPDPEIASGPDLTKAIIDRSSREGADVYRLAWRFSAKTLRDGVSGHEYDGSKGDDPDAYLARSTDADDAVREFYVLQSRGLRRAVTALREWNRRFPGAPHDPVPELLAYHAQAAQRRAAYRPKSEKRAIAWGYPAAAAVLLAGLTLFVRSRLANRRATTGS